MKLKNGCEVSVIPASEDCFAIYLNVEKNKEGKITKKDKWIAKVAAFKAIIDDIGEKQDGYVQLVPICQDTWSSYLEDEGDQIKFIGTKAECEKALVKA